MLNFAIDVERRTKLQFTSVPLAEIVASGSQFGEANAEKDEAEILVVRFPR
jgi:hypothetical protein